MYPLLQSLPYITDEYAELLLKPVNLPGTKGLVKNAAKKQLHKHMRTITPHLYNECMLENFIEKYVRISSENTREQFIDYVKYYVRQSIHAHTDKAKLNNVKSYEHRMALWADVNNTFLKNNVIHGEAEVNVPRAPYTSFEEPEDIEAIKS